MARRSSRPPSAYSGDVRGTRPFVAWLLGAGLLLTAMAVLWLDNQSVDIKASDYGTNGPAGAVECVVAPWDAGVNGNDEAPNGEHSGEFASEVAQDCYAVNMRRFDLGVGVGVGGLLLLGVAALTVRPRQSSAVE